MRHLGLIQTGASAPELQVAEAAYRGTEVLARGLRSARAEGVRPYATAQAGFCVAYCSAANRFVSLHGSGPGATSSSNLRDYTYWSQTVFDTQAVYVKKTPTTAYTYVIGTDTIAAGRNGYLNMGVFSAEPPILFGKPVGDTAVYDFQSFTISANAEQLLADLNASGAQGYCRAVGGVDTRGNLFLMKRVEPSPANCVYKVDDLPVGSMTEQGGLEQANRLGAQGYRQFAVIGHQYWVRDTTQQIRYSYEMVAAPTNAAELLAQLNEHGARGFEVYRQSATTYIYRRTLDCTRAPPLC